MTTEGVVDVLENTTDLHEKLVFSLSMPSSNEPSFSPDCGFAKYSRISRLYLALSSSLFFLYIDFSSSLSLSHIDATILLTSPNFAAGLWFFYRLSGFFKEKFICR